MARRIIIIILSVAILQGCYQGRKRIDAAPVQKFNYYKLIKKYDSELKQLATEDHCRKDLGKEMEEELETLASNEEDVKLVLDEYTRLSRIKYPEDLEGWSERKQSLLRKKVFLNARCKSKDPAIAEIDHEIEICDRAILLLNV